MQVLSKHIIHDEKNMSLFVYHNGVDRDLKIEIRKNLANRGHGHIN